MIYPCKFGEISPVGSRDNSHSYKKCDADRICTETSMNPSPPGEGGIKRMKLLVLLFISYALICILKRQIIYSHCPAAKQRRNDVILTSVGHDDVAVGRHFQVMCQ